MYAVKSCSPVEHFSNSTVNNTLDTVYNTMLSYTCQPGFKYPDDEVMLYYEMVGKGLYLFVL